MKQRATRGDIELKKKSPRRETPLIHVSDSRYNITLCSLSADKFARGVVELPSLRGKRQKRSSLSPFSPLCRRFLPRSPESQTSRLRGSESNINDLPGCGVTGSPNLDNDIRDNSESARSHTRDIIASRIEIPILAASPRLYL